MENLVQYVCIGQQKTEYPPRLYGDNNPNFITIRVSHGGFFTNPPQRRYVHGQQANFEWVRVKEMTPLMLSNMHKCLGYDGRGLWSVCLKFNEGDDNLDYHLIRLHCQEDIDRWRHKYLPGNHKYVLDFFIDPEPNAIHIFFPQTLRSCPARVIAKKLYDFVRRNPTADEDDATGFFLKKFDVWIPPNVLLPGLKLAKKQFRYMYGF